MALINPFPDCDWFYIDEDAYFIYLLKGYEIVLSHGRLYVCFSLDGKTHRDDGPAIIWIDGRVQYFQNDKLHREDGPAVIRSNGDVEYWLNGGLYSKEEYYKKLKTPVDNR